MLNKLLLFTICCSFFYMANLSAQNFVFNTLSSNNNCSPKFNLDIGIEIVGIKISNIYYDNPSQNTGSFGFEILFQYKNIFTGTIPSTASTFWTYSYSIKSNNNAIRTNNISNNIGNVPLRNTSEGILVSTQNNITYNGSATRLGFLANQIYTQTEVLELFDFSAFELTVNLPCLRANAAGQKINPILAIALQHWASTVDNNNVILNWQIENTNSIREFIIEKSNNAIDWQSISSINTNTNFQYSAIDYNPSIGNNYYRLKVINWDESIEYSAIIQEYIAEKSKQHIIAYPNPTKDFIELLNIENGCIVELINFQGNILFWERVTAFSSYKIPLQAYNAGFYILKITQNDGTISTQKIQIMP